VKGRLSFERHPRNYRIKPIDLTVFAALQLVQTMLAKSRIRDAALARVNAHLRKVA